MEEKREARSTEVVTAGDAVLEHRLHDDGLKHANENSSTASEGPSNDTGLAIADDSVTPRSLIGQSMASADEVVDILAELQISSTELPLTPNSEKTHREKKNESPVVVGYALLSPPTSPNANDRQEEGHIVDSPQYTYLPPSGGYGYHTTQEHDEILQSVTPLQSTYSQQQSPISYQDNRHRPSFGSFGGVGTRNTLGNLHNSAPGGSDVSTPSQGSNGQNSFHSDRREFFRAHSDYSQAQTRPQLHQRSVSNISYGRIDTNSAAESYGTYRAFDGGAQYQSRNNRRSRRRSRPASDFTPTTSSSALGGLGQTGPAFGRWSQQGQPPAVSPYGQLQQQQQHGSGGGGLAAYGFPASNQQGIESRLEDLAEGRLSAGTSPLDFKADAYALPASPSVLPPPWPLYQPGPHEQSPGYGPQAGKAPKSVFFKYPTREFTEGRVLLIDWAEPMGSTAGSITGSSVDGIHFHQKRRRFVIASTGPGHSFCLPILTYGNRACCKDGVKPNQHGIVYSQGHTPTPEPNEPPLGFEPIMMISDGSEVLRKESRINYAKPHPIEHNVKLRFIGHIHESQTASIQQNMYHAMQSHKLSMT